MTTPRVRTCLVAAGIAALAAAVRLHFAAGRELWYDDIGRMRTALLPWDRFWSDLPVIDNLKSPWLVGLHKLWVAAAGTGSILALRGWGVVCGVAIVLLTFALVRWIASTPVAAVTAIAVAVSPFFIRWSVEIHHYGPAAAATLGAWVLALREEPPTAARAAVVGALAGLAAGMFPPCGAALLPLLLLPGFRPSLRRPFVAFALAGIVVAVPSVVILARSQRIYAAAAAAAESPAWAAYFNPKKTPFETLARSAGLDVRQGAFAWPYAVCTGLVAVVCVARLWFSPERLDAPDAWRRRAALFLAGALPVAALWIVSALWIGVFNDRYLHGAAAVVPAALAVALCEFRSVRLGRLRLDLTRGLVGGILGYALGGGARDMFARGDGFPRELTQRSYACAALLDEAVREDPRPCAVFVHGEAQTCHVLLRSDAAHVGAPVFHLTTHAWLDVLTRREIAKTTTPTPYGWPFGVEVVAGRPLSASLDDARARLRADGRVRLVFENPPLVRADLLEDEERETGVRALWEAANQPQNPARDRSVESAARQALGAPAATVTIESDGNALLVEVAIR